MQLINSNRYLNTRCGKFNKKYNIEYRCLRINIIHYAFPPCMYKLVTTIYYFREDRL